VSTPSRGLWLDDCCENPPKKKLVAFEPNSSELTKGLKEGRFRCEARGVFVEKKRMGEERAEGNGLFLFQCFVFVFLRPYGLSKVV